MARLTSHDEAIIDRVYSRMYHADFRRSYWWAMLKAARRADLRAFHEFAQSKWTVQSKRGRFIRAWRRHSAIEWVEFGS